MTKRTQHPSRQDSVALGARLPSPPAESRPAQPRKPPKHGCAAVSHSRGIRRVLVNTENVDAVHEMSLGVYAGSIIDDAKTIEGTPVLGDDVLLWDTTKPKGQRGSLLFAENNHPFLASRTAGIDALYIFPAVAVSEPCTLALMGIGLAGLGFARSSKFG